MLALILLTLACKEDEVDACAVVAAEWEAELASVQACDEDEDCGLPLPGTSDEDFCRKVQSYDADTEQLYYILQLGDDLGCTLVPPAEEECPQADGFFCDDGLCAWDYAEAR